MKITRALLLLLILSAQVSTAFSQDLSAEVQELRKLLGEVQQDYQSRIASLEERLTRAERLASGAKRDAEEAYEIAEQTSIDQSSGLALQNVFNPAIGSVIVARYGNVDQSWETIPGFIPGGEIGPGGSGFSIGETDFNFTSNVDPNFFGNLTLAIENDGGETKIALEEVWIQTTSLPSGFSLIGGRFFSEAGYINKFHRHADDFSDRPLPYQAFFGGQYIADGIQARWIAPAALLIELGAELNWGGGFPATANNKTGPGAVTVFTNIGGDVGNSNSWQLGLSWLSADIVNRDDGNNGDSFSGDSDLGVFDFVWKWAPDGNPTVRSIKVQAEYFRRHEDGVFAGIPYDGDQSGWYLQGVWQFMQRWRAGYRHDVVDADNGPLFAGTVLEDLGSSSKRDSLMIDWSLSEFSRLRLQLTNDRVLPVTDQQLFLQYIMSIGAHGAHQF
ncbi:MAG: hypothetical protein IIC61_07500 [Proteobacteria bacterium]|nr:hypothetical protein [Pseudomonadota bacterium]